VADRQTGQTPDRQLYSGHSSELDPAARWLEHYEAVERRRRAQRGARLHLLARLPSPRRHQRMVATLIGLSAVLVGAAFAILWL
jgi:hypothetical protein